MADFEYCRLTTAGVFMAAKAMAGKAPTFTKIVMGSGDPPPDVKNEDLEAVVTPRVTLDITRKEVVNNSIAVLGGVFTNNLQHEGFKYKELGLYATDPDTQEETLFAYGHADDAHADWIAPSGSSTVVEKHIDVRTHVGNTAVMKVYISPDAWVTHREFEEHIADCNALKLSVEAIRLVAEDAKRIAEEALRIAREGSDRLDGYEGRLKSVENAMFENVTANPWSASFADLTGIKLNSGVWNKARGRLECSKGA